LQVFFEEGGNRLKALWRLAAQYTLYYVVLQFLASFLTITWFLISSPGEAFGETLVDLVSPAALRLIISLSALASVLFSTWLVGRFLDRRAFRDFGFNLNAGWLLDLFFGMALGSMLMSGIFFLQLAFGWVSVIGTFESAVPATSFWLALLLPVVIFLCAGISEEVLFRGYQLRNVAEGLNFPAVGPRGAILLSWMLTSGFFAVRHAGNPNATLLSVSNIALAGLLLGTGYVLTGELAIPIGFHITWNFFQSAVFGFPVSGLEPIGASFLATEQAGPDLWTGGAFGPEASLMLPVATLVGVSLTVLYVRLRQGRASIHTPLAEPPKTASETSEG
jgi:membrane protease YdiL (CAAX protease family)